MSTKMISSAQLTRRQEEEFLQGTFTNNPSSEKKNGPGPLHMT